MLLKTLNISGIDGVIRNIKFRKGLNLIVDETPVSAATATGNNVGKTTVLKLIDFCLGAKASAIYTSAESHKDTYELVSKFLIEKKVLITLTMVSDLEDPGSKEIVIERNFLSGKEKVLRVNGEKLSERELEIRLLNLIFPEHLLDKPSFRQIISHNIRYRDETLNSTLKTLNSFTKATEYETLYLYLFNCRLPEEMPREGILEKIKLEKGYGARLGKNQNQTAYEMSLALIESDIENLQIKRLTLNVNPDFQRDLARFNEIRYEISRIGSEISRISARRDLIEEASAQLRTDKSNVDLNQLALIYQQASDRVSGIQKTFEDLVKYHNEMVEEKINFITREVPLLDKSLVEHQSRLSYLLEQETVLAQVIAKGDSFAELEELISQLNLKFTKKGEYENIIQGLRDVQNNLAELDHQLQAINNVLFSDEFETIVKNQLKRFNEFFAMISSELYGEKYLISYEIVTHKDGYRYYDFRAFNANLSSGKKLGEISCFDLAYILFADDQSMSSLHFLLNDKKELMDDHQLVNIAKFVAENGIQFVSSILRDKLPPELNREELIVLKLSQLEKLFRIENSEE